MRIFIATVPLLAALMFQLPSTPPMKMGLWDSTSVTKMSGMAMPAGMTMPVVTVKVRSCMTPESYAKNLAASSQRKDCTISNETWGAKKYTFDMTCKNNMTGHFDMTFDSMEAGHAVVHMDMGHSMQADSTVESHFVSADCGSVTPDKPVISH